MSNFIKNDTDLMLLKEYANRLKNSGCDYSFLKDFLENFIIKDQSGNMLTDYNFDSNGSLTGYAFASNTLDFELEWTVHVARARAILTLSDYHFKENSLAEAECYMTLLIILHELEHSFQGLVGRGLVETPSTMLNSCYKQQYDLMVKINQKHNFYDCLRFALYMTFVFNASPSIFERNADIEACNALLKLANLEGNEEMKIFLEDIRLVHALYGYTLSRTGALVTTSRFMLSSPFLEGKEEKHTLSFEEKVRYGLPLTCEEHEKLMQLPFDGNNEQYPEAQKLVRNLQNK